MKVGIISDTHDYLDPKVPALLSGVDHILHAGDIGLPWLILQLENIAPVTAITGNTDIGLDFKETEVLELEGRRFLLHHIVNPHAPAPEVRRRIIRENPDAVIFGHTHKPFSEKINGTLYLNPGYAGKQRFKLPRSVAILHCDESGLRPEFKPLT
jgi:putative phosphoesterase